VDWLGMDAAGEGDWGSRTGRPNINFGGDGDRTSDSWYEVSTHNQLDCVDCDNVECGLYFDWRVWKDLEEQGLSFLKGNPERSGVRLCGWVRLMSLSVWRRRMQSRNGSRMDGCDCNRKSMGVLSDESLEMRRGRVCDRVVIIPRPPPPKRKFKGFPVIFSWRGSHRSQNTAI
jgi:hypothetical protein